MAHTQHVDNEFSGRFFADISDIHYCQLGVLRCLSSSATGQEFLPLHADQGIANIEPSHFFKALQSKRRLANITSLNDLLAGPMKHRIPDPYSQCAELDDWDLYAVDGHYHHAACFDKKSANSSLHGVPAETRWEIDSEGSRPLDEPLERPAVGVD